MSAQTVMLDFSVGEGAVEVMRLAEECVRKHVLGLDVAPACDLRLANGGALRTLINRDNGCSVQMRLTDAILTLNVDFYKRDDEPPLMPPQTARALEAQLNKEIMACKSQAYPPIKRAFFGRYFPTSDDRLLEYDIDSVVFEKNSPFQKIQIVHSKSLGNMLVLDELQNIAEADLIYTETLMQRGKENYEGAEIIILGGGDGALLYELLKENPKYIWMLEIDEDVMVACNKYMKSICGDVLETRKGANYEIIVDDCMVTLNKFIAQGRKFDYIFGDLTDIPISDTPSGEIWDFIRSILNTAFSVLKPTGKFMTHANGASCPEALKMYEDQLLTLVPNVEYTKASAFIPSFLEDWLFYQIFFKTDNGYDA